MGRNTLGLDKFVIKRMALNIPSKLVASPNTQTTRNIMLRPSALCALKLATNCGS